ncbi:MAG TPA: hypothetical protein VH439_01490 [Gemmatimonadales bacterium]|jgi:hypothetical protein
MRIRLFFAALSASVVIACSSAPSYYRANTVIPAPTLAIDSLRDLVVTRVRGLGFKVYEAQDALARLTEINVGVNATSDFLYADRESGCGLNCRKVEALLVSFAPDENGTHQHLTVTALTSKRGWVSPWRLTHPSQAVRQIADSLSGTFRH